MSGLEIRTGCYATARSLLGRPGTAVVRISLGKPGWYPYGGADLPYVKALAPAGWYFNEPDVAVYERRYRHQLHKTTPQRVLGMLHDVSRETGADRLVLCCFESNPWECHRLMFAQWWLEKTGEPILDLSEEPMGVGA